MTHTDTQTERKREKDTWILNPGQKKILISFQVGFGPKSSKNEQGRTKQITVYWRMVNSKRINSCRITNFQCSISNPGQKREINLPENWREEKNSFQNYHQKKNIFFIVRFNFRPNKLETIVARLIIVNDN